LSEEIIESSFTILNPIFILNIYHFNILIYKSKYNI